MEPDKQRAAWQARLEYYQDLGLGPFFLMRSEAARAAGALCGEAAEEEVCGAEGAPSGAEMGEKRASARKEARATVRAAAGTEAKAAKPPFEVLERAGGDTLEGVREFLGECTRCKLHQGRHSIVFGDGNPRARLVFIGEGPGHDEDLQGLPFVGRAGKLLTQMIEAMGLKRGDVYICNVVKCRPPGNRTPEKDEVGACSPFLFRQLEVIQPEAIVCLGSVALQALLGPSVTITRARGQWMEYRGMQMMPTYHPAYLLRNPAAKSSVWQDLKQVMALLGLEPRRAAR